MFDIIARVDGSIVKGPASRAFHTVTSDNNIYVTLITVIVATDNYNHVTIIRYTQFGETIFLYVWVVCRSYVILLFPKHDCRIQSFEPNSRF